jgi:hypothetical protein
MTFRNHLHNGSEKIFLNLTCKNILCPMPMGPPKLKEHFLLLKQINVNHSKLNHQHLNVENKQESYLN